MSSTHVVIFFLLISLHACNARRLDAYIDQKQLERNPHFPLKDDEKNGFDSLSRELGEVMKGENSTDTLSFAETEPLVSVSDHKVPDTGENNPVFKIMDYLNPEPDFPPKHN